MPTPSVPDITVITLILLSCNLPGNNVALQAEIAYCAYYYLLAQNIFMLQKVDVPCTFCNKKLNLLRAEVVIRATNNLNLQRNIVTRQVE